MLYNNSKGEEPDFLTKKTYKRGYQTTWHTYIRGQYGHTIHKSLDWKHYDFTYIQVVIDKVYEELVGVMKGGFGRGEPEGE